MSTPQREVVLAAAQASLAAMYPARLVMRGMVDPAELKPAELARGVFTFIATGRSGWNRNRGSEGTGSTLTAAVIGYLRLKESATPEELEAAEGVMEQEVVDWCGAIKAEPLDSVYPVDSTYSRGLERPVGWVVVNLEVLHV